VSRLGPFQAIKFTGKAEHVEPATSTTDY